LSKLTTLHLGIFRENKRQTRVFTGFQATKFHIHRFRNLNPASEEDLPACIKCRSRPASSEIESPEIYAAKRL